MHGLMKSKKHRKNGTGGISKEDKMRDQILMSGLMYILDQDHQEQDPVPEAMMETIGLQQRRCPQYFLLREVEGGQENVVKK